MAFSVAGDRRPLLLWRHSTGGCIFGSSSYRPHRSNPHVRKDGMQGSVGHVRRRAGRTKERVMLTTIAVILLVLWLLGLVSSYTLSGFIHVLLVIALVMLIVSFVSGRRTL